MGAISPSFVQVQPSYVLPELLLAYQQASGAFELLGTGNPMVRLSEGDQQVYIKRLDVRTAVNAGQSAYNQLPGVQLDYSQISTPTYLLRMRVTFDHHDTSASSRWGVALPEAYRLGMRQGMFQTFRNALLYGMNPAGGEGLINANGATLVNLPADSYGNTTCSTYDNGQMAQFLLQQIGAAKRRCNQLGMPVTVVVCAPQEILEQFEYQGIVQLTQFQRQGGGVASVRAEVANVLEWSGDELEWVYDDTLIGKGSGGTDAMLIVIPEIKKPEGGKINTNEFANLSPGLDYTTIQLCDMPAPREIVSPLAGGATDVVAEMRITSGWAVRPEAVSVISMAV